MALHAGSLVRDDNIASGEERSPKSIWIGSALSFGEECLDSQVLQLTPGLRSRKEGGKIPESSYEEGISPLLKVRASEEW